MVHLLPHESVSMVPKILNKDVGFTAFLFAIIPTSLFYILHMLHDFFNQCKVGTNFKQHIRKIQEDKNRLVSHISNHSDILNVKILELTAIKNIRSFLTYLQNSTWSYPKKQEFVDKYQEKVETITAGIFKEVDGDDKKTVEFESTRRNYLARLISEQAENSLEYIPLSYKVDDGTAMRFNLEELFTLPNNNRGFVIFSKEAGYGKTWSIQELAGQCANRVLKEGSENIPTPILIRIGELAVSEEPIIQAVQEILFPGSDNVEMAKEFIRENQVILFVDGMDEADIDNKEPIRRELRRLLTNAGGVTLIGGTRESDRQLYPEELPQYSICDLSDEQVKAFIDKLILNEEQKKSARYDYFENSQTSFLKSLRSPFYLKCFIDFVKEGQKAPLSDTDMMNRCIDKMIEREISKGFKVTVQIVNEFLAKLSELIGNERNCVIEQEALEAIEKSLIYDKTEYASVARIKDTLVELQILREVVPERQAVLLGFWHSKYKSLFSPVALNMDLWEW